jgi:hypothetical protein
MAVVKMCVKNLKIDLAKILGFVMLTTPPWVTRCCLAHSKGAGASSKQSLPSKNINKLFTHPILTRPQQHIPRPLQIHLQTNSPALF